jgi:hypothetical protein
MRMVTFPCCPPRVPPRCGRVQDRSWVECLNEGVEHLTTFLRLPKEPRPKEQSALGSRRDEKDPDASACGRACGGRPPGASVGVWWRPIPCSGMPVQTTARTSRTASTATARLTSSGSPTGPDTSTWSGRIILFHRFSVSCPLLPVSSRTITAESACRVETWSFPR